MPFRRIVHAYLVEAKYESIRMLRMPGFVIPFLGLPVGLYLLFAVLLYGDVVIKDPKTALYMFMGFAIFGVMGPGMFGFGVTVAMERDQGLLKLKRALPTPPAAPLLAKMLMSMGFVALIFVTMVAAAPLGHARLSAMQLLSVSIVGILGSLPFCAMGFFIGSLTSGKAAPAFVNIAYLPMIYLSGFLIPLPKSMGWVEHLSPAYHLDQIALASIGAPNEGSLAVHMAVLAGIALVLTPFAVRKLARS
jgi:ABC-2 type transport system permease protein